jgi:polynucleotide 5'-hydroxyl-kinase GRC3/NOL9
MAAMQVPVSWVDLGRKLRARGVVLVVGQVNAGKSTLVRYLAHRASEEGLRTALVDADLGQASFGPPTCMSLMFWPAHASPALRFIGATSPAGHLLESIVGVKLLVERALAKRAQRVLIDTSGMATGPLGTTLKLHKIELVHPDDLVVLQRESELEGLLDRLPRLPKMRVHRLAVSPEARARGPAERSAYRRSRFEDYFKEAEVRSISLRRPRRLLLGPPLTPGRLVGLIDAAGETLGLGVVKYRDSEKVEMFTPVAKNESVRTLRGGVLRLKEDWTEA